MSPEDRAIKVAHDEDWDDDGALRALIQQQIEAAVAEENEACARVAESLMFPTPQEISAAIRSRGASGQTGPVSG